MARGGQRERAGAAHGIRRWAAASRPRSGEPRAGERGPLRSPSGSRPRAKSPAAGERFASLNPATGEVLGYVVAAGAAASQRGGAGGAARPAHLVGDDRRGAGADIAPCRRAVALAQSGIGRARIARHRQAHSGNPGGGCRLGGGVFRIFCGPRAILERRAHRSGLPSVRLYAARTSRGRGGHRRLELSAANRLLEGGAGARLRQRHDFQTGGAHALHGGETAGDSARGRPAARGLPSRAGLCRDRPPAHAPSRHPQGVAHRRGRHGQGRDERRCADAQERDARARRQVAADRFRGCQTRQRGCRRAPRPTSIPPDRCARTPRGYSSTPR